MIDNTILTIAAIAIFIIGPFWLIYKMDKRTIQKGSLFTGQATSGNKAFALVLGFVFLGIALFEAFILKYEEIHLAFPLLSLALCCYVLGAGDLLKKLQGQGTNKTTEVPTRHDAIIESIDGAKGFKRFLDFGKTITTTLILAGLFLSCAWWVSQNPDNLFSWIFLVGIILFIMLMPILKKLEILRHLIKKDRE